jgi:hypothetical protein
MDGLIKGFGPEARPPQCLASGPLGQPPELTPPSELSEVIEPIVLPPGKRTGATSVRERYER